MRVPSLALASLVFSLVVSAQPTPPTPSQGGTGTVTSVGFTGGIVTIATPTTTPAFTIAGTSGGVPYFNSTSTWASSAAGTINHVMGWGGAGNAPVDLGALAAGTITSIVTTSPISGGTCSSGACTISLLVNVDHAFTAAQSITRSALGVGVSAGLSLINTTAATNGAQQLSPQGIYTGAVWSTTAAASQVANMAIDMFPMQGTSTTLRALARISHQVNGAGYLADMQIGNNQGTTSVWLGNITPSNTNYAILVNGGTTVVNALTTLQFALNDTVEMETTATHISAPFGSQFAFSSTTNPASTLDTGLSRDSAGVIDFGTGTVGSAAGSWKATNGTLSGTFTLTAGAITTGGKVCTINTTTGVWSCV